MSGSGEEGGSGSGDDGAEVTVLDSFSLLVVHCNYKKRQLGFVENYLPYTATYNETQAVLTNHLNMSVFSRVRKTLYF